MSWPMTCHITRHVNMNLASVGGTNNTMTGKLETENSLVGLFLVQIQLKIEVLMHPKFNPTWVRTHDLQIITVHFMSLRCLL